jgi:Raf kinase inhibitor-like YbhB/YbcL family protein
MTIVGFTLGSIAAITAQGQGGGRQGGAPAGPPFTITIAGGLPDGSDFPVKYSQAGDNTSPAIAWANAPSATVTFLLHMHDMDNARNKTSEDQLHWIVWNIPASETGLPENVPKGPQLANGAFHTSATGVGVYRGPGFAGPGPKHHYVFELFALDTKIDVPNGEDMFATRAKVLAAAQGHILGKAVWMSLFRRPPAPPQ